MITLTITTTEKDERPFKVRAADFFVWLVLVVALSFGIKEVAHLISDINVVFIMVIGFLTYLSAMMALSFSHDLIVRKLGLIK